jgi:hypothetical protein
VVAPQPGGFIIDGIEAFWQTFTVRARPGRLVP